MSAPWQVRAGWIVLEPAAADYRHFYEITDAGRAVLDGAR